MTQIDESTRLSIQLRIRKEAVKYPAKTHAYKVKRELAASDSSSATGLIYLPGQNSEQYEDTDGYYLSAQFPSSPCFSSPNSQNKALEFGRNSALHLDATCV